MSNSLKILITGSNGLLGNKLIHLFLKKGINFLATSRGENRFENPKEINYKTLDITNASECKKVILDYKPTTIINTAAMTMVDDCEVKKEECKALNIIAVENICNAAALVKAHIIHLSTDFIFDGKNGPYKETDKANPLSFYGWSKLESEKVVAKYPHKWSILRTVLLYGSTPNLSRNNIVLWARQALKNKDIMNVVDDQYRTPTLAEDLAKGCLLCAKKEAEGVFNISGKDFMSIYQLVERVAKFYGFSTERVNKVSTNTLNQKAKRPPKTGFDLSKSKQILGYKPLSFEEGLVYLEKEFPLE